MVEADLHLHTTASDGKLTPEQLVHTAAQRGLKAIAITDHDTTAGLPPALEVAKGYPSLTVIPGVELSTDVPDGEVHILGLFIDYLNAELQQTLARLRDSRMDRGKRMAAKLADLGMPIDWDRVLKMADGGAIGRPHIAQVMVEQGYVATPQEAFDKYISRNGPAYAEREKFTPEEAVAVIQTFKGSAILCHPGDTDDLRTLVARLKGAGLTGMEVYYGNYSHGKVKTLAQIARQFDLLPCGGSDYHGFGNNFEVGPGEAGPPMWVVERLSSMAGQRTPIIS